MNKEYHYIYNNFIKLTTNKTLYKGLKNQDTFYDRLLFFLIHFAFFLKAFKSKENTNLLQKIYDHIFRYLELSIREIGYGDQSINKKMKDYINLFHSIVSEIHFWPDLTKEDKKKRLVKFFSNFGEIDYLIEYFDDFYDNLSKKTLNSFLKDCK